MKTDRWMLRPQTRMMPLAVLAVAALALTALPVSAQMDPTGYWTPKMHEDAPERGQGPEIGDYTGLPLNDEARAKADSWKASVQTLPERQCIPHPFPYSLRGPANMKITADADPITGQTVDYKMIGTFGRANHTVWMDGRPHPPQDAYHWYEGFTTGQWEGNVLTTYTDHIKMGYLRRNGVPTSDETTVIEHWTRHGNILTAVVFVEDPAYLTEPFVRSSSWVWNPAPQAIPDEVACESVEEEDRPKGFVPHWLPGANPSLNEITQVYGIPADAARGGAETMYPEYRKKLKNAYVPPTHCTRYCCDGPGARAIAGCEAGVGQAR